MDIDIDIMDIQELPENSSVSNNESDFVPLNFDESEDEAIEIIEERTTVPAAPIPKNEATPTTANRKKKRRGRPKKVEQQAVIERDLAKDAEKLVERKEEEGLSFFNEFIRLMAESYYIINYYIHISF